MLADSKNVYGLYTWWSTLTSRSKKVKNSWNCQIFSIYFLRWPVVARTDLKRYKTCTFLESRRNLQLKNEPYHCVGHLISVCGRVFKKPDFFITGLPVYILQKTGVTGLNWDINEKSHILYSLLHNSDFHSSVIRFSY
jgi:hypothetical protein